MSGTLTYDGCVLAGQGTHVHCGFTLTEVAWGAGTPARTTGVIDVTCVQRLTAPNTALCHIEGTIPFAYINPSGVRPGRVTLLTGGTGLTVTGVAGSPIISRAA